MYRSQIDNLSSIKKLIYLLWNVARPRRPGALRVVNSSGGRDRELRNVPKALHNAEQLPRLNPSRAVPRTYEWAFTHVGGVLQGEKPVPRCASWTNIISPIPDILNQNPGLDACDARWSLRITVRGLDEGMCQKLGTSYTSWDRDIVIPVFIGVNKGF